MHSDLKEYWQPIIDELLKSGLSGKKFALEENLPPTKVNYWAHSDLKLNLNTPVQ